METGENCSISDWDRPLTDQELEAIEAAFQSATTSSSSTSSPIKQRHVPTRNDGGDGDRPTARRRLPGSIASEFRRGDGSGSESNSMMCVSDSFSLLPCPRNRFFDACHSSTPGPLQEVKESSRTAKLKMRYPTMTFKGQIVYSRTFGDVEKAAKELLEIVETRKRGVDQVILGFDIEWRPTFRRGVSPGKAAVMQICGDTSHCYVMHIIHSGIPQNLQALLEDPTSVKVGVGIVNDAFKVFKDHNVSIKGLEDLSGLANQKLGGDPKKWSLASLTEMLICKQLPKPEKIRLGNWEADFLSKEQLEYAATDAFVSWYLHQALNCLPDAADNKCEELGNEPLQ
ncbi:hypothetical protein TEA_005614 [Camellia sinensis var. sinensis]|uniref:3'-5' exonuclease n=1 Tax=Camellia sinensis var. sinensis TaxID=542762 RepID=A0A4S4F154_CAMSN|nr:hypothetical protein TEA_005614 [Camellia sinensis var. sinensis]